MDTPSIHQDWEILKKFLPEAWEVNAVKLGALTRKRNIKSEDALLRVLLMHFAAGKSLRTTAAYAHELNICDINDTSLLHRLRASEDWLRWMSSEILKEISSAYPLPGYITNKFERVRLVDGSSISGPGSKGTDWRIHYCFRLNSLTCDTFEITTQKEGECYQRYPVEPNDLLIGDRAYCKRKGIFHILDNHGDALVRFHSTNLPLLTLRKAPFDVLKHLRKLGETEVGDWNVWFSSSDDKRISKGRLCAIRKSKDATELAQKKIRKEASKKGYKLRPETLEYAGYIIVFTTSNRFKLKGHQVLELYRGRWQVELAFKRLKSILRIGDLPTKHKQSSIAWLYGKMLVALLIERLYQEAEAFSPWGYPI